MPHTEPDSAARPGYYPSASQQSSKRKQVEQILDLLYRRRVIIIVAFVVVGAVAAFRAFTETPVYETSAVVLLDIARMPGGQTEEVVGNTPFVRSERSQATEIFILQNSYSIAQRVNERLREMQSEGAAINVPPQGSVRFEPASRSIASAITVRASSPNPTEAAILANVYAEEYIKQTQDASRQHLAASREFLQDQEARRSAELEAAEQALMEYQQRSGSLALSPQAGQLVGRMVGLETQRDEALIELQMRQAQMSTLENRIEEIDPRLSERMISSSDRRLAGLTEQLNQLEMRRQAIQSTAARRGQDAIDQDELARVERRIDEVEREMRQINEQHLTELMAVGGAQGAAQTIGHAADLQRQRVQEQIALRGLEARLNTMNQRLGQYRSEIGTIPELSTDLARLERDRQLAEQMYQYVVQRLQDVRIQEESEPGYARVLRHAGTPSIPVGPGAWRGTGVGLLLGLLAGLALAIMRDRLDTRIYKVEQLRDHGGVVLGLIPNLRPHIEETHDGAEVIERDGEMISTSLVTLVAPLSAPSEAFRHVRTTLQFSRLDRVVETVVVTSAGQGDGKTTTAANLAITFAQSHRRTVLIDADLRRSRVDDLFGKSHKKGLAQLLTEEKDLDSTRLRSVMRRHESSHHPNLFVLPAGHFDFGRANINPAELIGSKRMRELLALLKEDFDAVVIDTPPALAATDGVLLATQADAVVIVVRAGGTKEGDLDHTIEMLEDVGAPIAGMVLNGFDLSMAYGYRYSYGHYSKVGPYSRYGYGPKAGGEPVKA